MVAMPAWVWRFPPFVRALIVGLGFGIVVGLLALIGSNNPLAGLAAVVVVTPLYGAIMGRRLSKYWPGAKELDGADRVEVARTTRIGRDIGDARLAPAVIDYARGLHEAADRKLWRWLIAVLGVVALGSAIFDTINGPVGEAVVSWLYFAFFPIEAWLWPRRQAQLLANAERAEESARNLMARQPDTA